MKSDRQIAEQYSLLYKVTHQEHEQYNNDVLAALAAARADEREKWNLLAGIKEAIAAGRAEQHAECVQLLMERGQYAAASWLDSHKP